MQHVQALHRRTAVALTGAAVVIFAAYAASFLYFFVDDEAIPLVYARNILRGRGFVYTTLEGRVEGFSDFLHVLWSTVLLAGTHAAGLSLGAPLLIGKVVSFLAAIAVIVVAAWFLARQGASAAGLAAALGFLALCGPLALWACSSLETAPFAFLLISFAASIFDGLLPAAIALGIALVLERIDGAVFVFVVLLVAAEANPANAPRCWTTARWIALPAAIFHAWRFWYFGSIVSAPLAAKVMYHFIGSAHALVKPPVVPYLLGLARLYGSPLPAIAALAGAFLAARPHRTAKALMLAVVVLGLYVQLVGDWMFGWRLTVALFPMLAVVFGLAVSRLPRRAGWVAATVLCLWSASAAYRFQATFVANEHKPLFWSQPHGTREVWLAPYYDAVKAAMPLIHRGDRIAYNQAGLLPYLLDVENIDDLGICSRFVAALPTTDVYFTGVGRYSPLTDQPILRTAHAYLLYQDVQFIIARGDLLWRANGDRIPDTLLDGYFTRASLAGPEQDAIYRRTDKPGDQYRRDPTWFSENVAHTSRLTYAAIGGRALTPDRFGPELPFLREGQQARTFSGDLEIDLHFARGAQVSALYLGKITTTRPATLSLQLADESGRSTLTHSIAVAPGGMTVLDRFDVPARAGAASLRIDVDGQDRVVLEDVRLEGQSRALHDYVRRMLRFPTP